MCIHTSLVVWWGLSALGNGLSSVYMRLFFQGALKQPFEMSPSMKDVSKIIVSFLFYLGAISEAQAFWQGKG